MITITYGRRLLIAEQWDHERGGYWSPRKWGGGRSNDIGREGVGVRGGGFIGTVVGNKCYQGIKMLESRLLSLITEMLSNILREHLSITINHINMRRYRLKSISNPNHVIMFQSISLNCLQI